MAQIVVSSAFASGGGKRREGRPGVRDSRSSDPHASPQVTRLTHLIELSEVVELLELLGRIERF